MSPKAGAFGTGNEAAVAPGLECDCEGAAGAGFGFE
jgi:hypothetical protein